MSATEFRPSLKHLLVLLYLVSLVLLVFLLKLEDNKNRPAFSVSTRSVLLEAWQDSMNIRGENLHDGLNGVAVESLVTRQALLWQQLDDVPTTEVAVHDDLLLAVTPKQSKLISFRLLPDRPPRFLGSIQLQEKVSAIFIIDDKALIGLKNHKGVAVIDLKDPTDLQLVQMLDGTGVVTAMMGNGTQIYYTDIYKGVGLIDMSGPEAHMKPLARIDSPWRLAKVGDKLAAGTLKGHVYLFDVLADGALREVGMLEYPFNVRGVVMTDQALTVALADKSLRIYQLGAWPKLKKSARLSLIGSPLSILRIPGSSKALVSIVSAGLTLIDLSDPSQPVVGGQLAMSRTFKGLDVQADTFYGGSLSGLEAFSLAKVESDTQGQAHEVLVDNEHFKFKSWNGVVAVYADGHVSAIANSSQKAEWQSRYLAVNEKDTISLYDLDNDKQFRPVGSEIRLVDVRDAMMLGDYLYILNGGGMQVRVATSRGNFEVVANLPLPGRGRALEPLNSSMMLVATRDEGVHFVDISKPASPLLQTTIAPEKHLQAVNITYDLLVDKNRVYVTSGPGGVYVLDVSRPHAPKLVHRIATRDFAKKMVMIDGLLLVADGLHGLFMIDTKTNDVAVPVGSWQMPFRVDNMAVTDKTLLVSNRSMGTFQLPQPRRVIGIETVSPEEVSLPLHAFVDGADIFLYDNRNAERINFIARATRSAQ